MSGMRPHENVGRQRTIGKAIPRGVSAFSLVEVVIALGLVSFVIVAVIGLFSVGLQATRDSEESIDATNLAAEIIGKRFAAPTNDLPPLDGQPFVLEKVPPLESLPSSPQWAASVSKISAPGGYETNAAGKGSFLVTYAYWRDTNSAPGTNSRMVKLHLFLSSPAEAPLDRAPNRYEVLTSHLMP